MYFSGDQWSRGISEYVKKWDMWKKRPNYTSINECYKVWDGNMLYEIDSDLTLQKKD